VVGLGHTVLLVPVPTLEPFVRARWEHYDPTWVSTDRAFAHAHVTVLSPFLQPPIATGAGRRVERVLRRHRAFEFELRRIDTFPNGIIHALPEPDDGFRRLTAELVAAFPQCPPYAGEFPDPVPHLTLDLAQGEVTEESVTAAVAGLLPATGCRADRVQLAWYAQGGCRVLQEWPLT
jgi:2'-5' RNA ligase